MALATIATPVSRLPCLRYGISLRSELQRFLGTAHASKEGVGMKFIFVFLSLYPKGFVPSLLIVFHEQQFTESAVCNVTEFK